jgi:DNA repair protein RadC
MARNSTPANQLTDAQLVKLLCGKNCNIPIRELGVLALRNSAKEFSLCEKSPDDEDAFKASAAFELVFRLSQYELSEASAMRSPAMVKDHLTTKLASVPHEVFYCMFLNSQHRLIAGEEMFRGTINQTAVYPREIVKRALYHNAAAVVLSHNHPSGSLEPSNSDHLLTKGIIAALGTVDIRVLDHIIVGGMQTFSFAEKGLL